MIDPVAAPKSPLKKEGGSSVGCVLARTRLAKSSLACVQAHTLLRRLAVCWLLGLLVLLTGCAGYQIGTQSLYPCHIQTVYVPIFESASFRRNLGEQLTEAVAKEIELKTPYKVVGDPGADSILSGRIVSESKRVVAQARSGEAREVEVNLGVEVSWLDRQGSAIRRSEAIRLPAELVDVDSNATLVPEVGQSVATAHQEAIHRVAQQIVGLMENPW